MTEACPGHGAEPFRADAQAGRFADAVGAALDPLQGGFDFKQLGLFVRELREERFPLDLLFGDIGGIVAAPREWVERLRAAVLAFASQGIAQFGQRAVVPRPLRGNVGGFHDVTLARRRRALLREFWIRLSGIWRARPGIRREAVARTLGLVHHGECMRKIGRAHV